MLRACALAVVVIELMACGKGGGDKASPAPEPTPPIAIRFGACAGPTVAWVSGPRPSPFTPDEAAGVYAAIDPPTWSDVDVPPPEPPDEPAPEPSAGEERKARLARQQAIEQARNAGILGSAALRQGGAFASLTAPDDFFAGKDIYDGMLPNEAGPAPIGTGTLGGTDRFGGNGRPSLSLAAPNAQGDLDKALIRRVVRTSIPKIQYCYEKQLLVKPTLRGTVKAQFFIAHDGKVASSHAEGLDPDVANCVADVIKGLTFPAPKGGGGVQVNYPFTFRPADDAASTTKMPPPATPPTPSSATATAPPVPPSPAVPRTLFRPPAAPPLDASSSRPDDSNPLRTEQAALETCFRTHSARHGVAVVELGYDAAGAVTAATVHGIDDTGVRDCVAAAAKRVKRTSGDATAERCSFA
ncbi:MAG TPA: AgmX/PglI C-terminal domain-containing protein, partial [Kofleriaceae bacterium]|nr:AgmX/PglI C-terminal domain-containing protein [Kofleriaceae bacterium]